MALKMHVLAISSLLLSLASVGTASEVGQKRALPADFVDQEKQFFAGIQQKVHAGNLGLPPLAKRTRHGALNVRERGILPRVPGGLFPGFDAGSFAAEIDTAEIDAEIAKTFGTYSETFGETFADLYAPTPPVESYLQATAATVEEGHRTIGGMRNFRFVAKERSEPEEGAPVVVRRRPSLVLSTDGPRVCFDTEPARGGEEEDETAARSSEISPENARQSKMFTFTTGSTSAMPKSALRGADGSGDESSAEGGEGKKQLSWSDIASGFANPLCNIREIENANKGRRGYPTQFAPVAKPSLRWPGEWGTVPEPLGNRLFDGDEEDIYS